MAYRISETPEYQAWERMKYRCSSEHDPDWADYGGRGITVCDAAKAHDKAVFEVKGFGSWLNFPDEYKEMVEV